MRVDEHPDARSFRAAAEAFVERDEAASSPVAIERSAPGARAFSAKGEGDRPGAAFPSAPS